jgi:hypothetical protein
MMKLAKLSQNKQVDTLFILTAVTHPNTEMQTFVTYHPVVQTHELPPVKVKSDSQLKQEVEFGQFIQCFAEQV